MTLELGERIARHYRSPFLRGYVRLKVAIDPLYAAVASHLDSSELPLLDIGCGAGLLSFYLRERGLSAPITGLDHDEEKIAAAQAVANGSYSGLTFRHGDALAPIHFSGNVTLLDVLHYLPSNAQQTLLKNAIAATAPDGLVMIRECLREPTWRYRATWLEEWLAMSIRWLKGSTLNFPTRDAIVAPFETAGFTSEVRPLRGSTPYNNYLMVFRRGGKPAL